MRFSFRRPAAAAPAPPPTIVEHRYIEIDPGVMDSAFVAPKWLRDIGLTSWYAVGAVLLLVAAIGLLALTSAIVVPLIVAGIIAAVASPLVAWFQRLGLPRVAAAILTVLLLLAALAGVAYGVMSGIVSQADQASRELNGATSEITAWLYDHGIDRGAAEDAQADVEQGAQRSISTLLTGVVGAIGGLTSIAFALAMIMISLIFLLKDGPTIRGWTERHMGVPEPVARVVTGRVVGSLRGYFLGVTIIAAFNALVVGIGAWIFDVPLISTIMVATFVCAYVPFIGAWVAGIFTVLVAFGSPNESAVVAMIVVVLLANGVLQQIVQPVAYGAALGIHPLAALVATIGAGSLFGTIGLILGAPLVSAAVKITADLANSRAQTSDDDGPQSTESPPVLAPG